MEHILKFRKLKDELPKNDTKIFSISIDNFYGTFEFRYGEVEYQWQEIDEDGYPTGTSFIYEEGIQQPPNTKLLVTINGINLSEDVLWTPCKEVEAMLESAS